LDAQTDFLARRLSSGRQPLTIGLFDSGVGGLTVLRELENALGEICSPAAIELVYIGDTLRCPYGDRSAAEISEFASQSARWLVNRGANYLIIACNTSASLAGDLLRQDSPVPVYDLIAPAARAAARAGGSIAVLSTTATARSRAFTKAIRAVNPAACVIEIACPKLVPLIEAGQIEAADTIAALKEYTSPVLQQRSNCIVFGCTHYPFLRKALARLLPEETGFIDPASALVCELLGIAVSDSLPTSDAPSRSSRCPTSIFTTGNPDSFAATARACLGFATGPVHPIALDQISAPYAMPTASTGRHG